MSDLYEDMACDEAIVEHLRTREGAEEFARALCNMQWEKISVIPEDELIIDRLKGVHRDLWHCSWRCAGGYIADIRHKHHGMNENYMDFYCVGDEGYVSDFVRDNFKRLGWLSVPYDGLGI